MNAEPSSLRVVLISLLMLYVAVGALYAVYTPLWQAPDEPAHFNYLRYVAEQKRFPILEMGDYPAAYLEEIKSQRFPPDISIEPIRYEAWQPPLYYSLGALLYLGTRSLSPASQVLVLRLLSVLLGAGVTCIAYHIIHEIFPEHHLLALTSAAFGAVVPMHVAMSAAINNDVLAELILSAILFCCVKLLRHTYHHPAAVNMRRLADLGVLVGLGLLTKLTTGVSIALVAAALWMAETRAMPAGRLARWAKGLLCILGLALLISGGWFLRNALVYGWNDPLIWQRHAQVVQGQLTTAEYLRTHGVRAWLMDLATTTSHSFWGQFGWMAVPMDGRIYLALWMICGLAGLGLVSMGYRALSSARSRHQEHVSNAAPSADNLSPLALSTFQHQAVELLAFSVVLTFASYLWYNRQLVQFQGRYLFPAVVALGFFFAWGLCEIFSCSHARWLAGLSTVGAACFLGLGLIQGNVNKWGVLLFALAGVALWIKALLPPRWNKLYLVLTYAGLLSLTVASPFFFIAPYLAAGP